MSQRLVFLTKRMQIDFFTEKLLFTETKKQKTQRQNDEAPGNSLAPYLPTLISQPHSFSTLIPPEFNL
jgi:hypothetical protein